MSILKTQINSRSQAFSDNAEHMQSLVDDLTTLVERIKQGGGERYQARHQARGKLLPRDRVDLLIDPGSPFLEFSQRLFASRCARVWPRYYCKGLSFFAPIGSSPTTTARQGTSSFAHGDCHGLIPALDLLTRGRFQLALFVFAHDLADFLGCCVKIHFLPFGLENL